MLSNLSFSDFELNIPGDPEGKIIYDVLAPTDPAQAKTLLVLVNGFQRDRKDFRALRKRLHESVSGLITVAADNRGCGETHTSTDFTLSDLASDIRRIRDSVCKTYSLSRFFLLGISMGGMIAQLAAAQGEKKEWDGLALISTTGGGPLRVWSEDTRRSSDWPESLDELKIKMRAYFGEKFIKNSPLLIDAMAKTIHKTARSAHSKGGARAQHAASKAFDGSEALQKIRGLGLPVLIATGDEDRIIAKENSFNLKNAIGECAELILYPGVGHLILIEEPQQFSQDVEHFIQR